MTLESIVEQLKAGKRLEVKNLMYVYPPIPVIYLEGEDGSCDVIEMEEVTLQTIAEYLIEQPINRLESIKIEYYREAKKIPILYIFTNPQGSEMYARLANGEYEEYQLSVLDIDKVVGEYTGIPVVEKEDDRTVSLKDLHDVLVQAKFPEDKVAEVWSELVNKARG